MTTETASRGPSRRSVNREVLRSRRGILPNIHDKSSAYPGQVSQSVKLQDDGVISKVWIDPEVLEDPLYVDFTVHRSKHFVVFDGEVKTVTELLVKRKHNMYDSYDRSLLVVPKPSTDRLTAYLSPYKTAAPFVRKESFKRARSEMPLPLYKAREVSSVAVATSHRQLNLNQKRSKVGCKMNRTSREVRPAISLGRIKSRVLESLIVRKRLIKLA
jgi:hypothetical protein